MFTIRSLVGVSYDAGSGKDSRRRNDREVSRDPSAPWSAGFKAQRWGRLFTSLGKTLTACGDALPNLDLSGFPDKADMLDTREELASLNAEIAQLRKHLGCLGINVTSQLDVRS